MLRLTFAAMKYCELDLGSSCPQKNLRCLLISSLIQQRHFRAIVCSTQSGATRIIRTPAPLTRTSFTLDKSWNRIRKNRVSFLPYTALDTNSWVRILNSIWANHRSMQLSLPDV